MTDKPTPTTDLLKRCAEIHEWRSTGVLSGEALRDYAKRKWPDRHDTLQMAEHETVTEALALLAKWGHPAQAAEPVANVEVRSSKNGTTLTLSPDFGAFSLPEGLHKLYPAHQPVAREQLTPERVKEIVRGAGYDQCGIPDTERAAFINGLRHGEREHGITGDQHG